MHRHTRACPGKGATGGGAKPATPAGNEGGVASEVNRDGHAVTCLRGRHRTAATPYCNHSMGRRANRNVSYGVASPVS